MVKQTVFEEDKVKAEKIFHHLGGFHSNVFKKKWAIWHFESTPFFDTNIYSSINSFFKKIGEKQIKIFEYPLNIGDDFFCFEELPLDFNIFNDFQKEYYLNFVGGIAYGSNLDWGMHSDADNSILIIGCERSLVSEKIKKLFDQNPFLLDTETLMNKFGYSD